MNEIIQHGQGVGPLFSGFRSCIPKEISGTTAIVNWKEIPGGDKPRKTPVNHSGNPTAYNSAGASKTFNEAIEMAERTGFGVGVSLGSGLQVTAHGFTGYLWCLDFDGFCHLKTGEIDAELSEILNLVEGYLELSPSNTGAKLFFSSDKMPETKTKIRFAPSKWAGDFPAIKKYRDREIEVFSKNSFLALTGDRLFDECHTEIINIKSDELDRLLDRIEAIAKDGGGLGREKAHKERSTEPSSPRSQITGYGRLTQASLKRVLEAVDPDAESCWSDTANALARVYGEDGRNWFHQYSKRSDKYEHDKAEARFDRALNDLKKKPAGVGMKRLIELSSLPALDTLALEWEEELGSRRESSADLVSNVESLFEDLELRQEDVDAMADADILYPGMIVRGHVQAYVSPANGGKTTIMVYVCEKLAAQGLQVLYVNVDGSPGDLKRHHEHAKQHGYKLIAPDARQGGSAKIVLEKMYQLAESNQKLDEYVFIFDTLKKFVAVIDKAKAAEFFKLTRSLSVKGATVILLGHTNKHKDDDGNTIFEGTGDLRNDVDELIYLDSFKNDGDGTLEVTTRPDKVRAELEPRTFIIDLKNNRKVSESGYVKKIIAKEQREVLEIFKEAINAGLGSQTELLDYAEPKTSIGKTKLRKLLIEFTLWDVPEIVGEKMGRAKDLKYTLAVGGSL